MISELEGMNRSVPVSRMRPSSSPTLWFATPNYIPLCQYDQIPSDSITLSSIRKPVGFPFRLLGGAKIPLAVGQIMIDGAAEEDGGLHKKDEDREGHKVRAAPHSESTSKQTC